MAQEIFRVYGSVAIREDGDIEQRMNDIGNSAEGSGNKFKDLIETFGGVELGAAALAGTLSTLVIAALKESWEFSQKWKDTLGDLSFETNATTEEMKMFNQSMQDIYLGGYGENIEDVADAIADVHRQTGATNDALDEQTEKTMALSDKLETDYGETIRTVDNLVKIFGMTHDEAFDLIARGYQENLNVGGDLLDLFNEYSVKLEQLGFDENDMLNILLEGQEQGIFNYDLLLDGIKEYQIRVMELAEDQKGSKDFFKELGLNVKEVNQAYKEGGQAAEDMSIKIWEALDSIEDPLEKNRIGTELFGTMWEDTGGKISDAALGVQRDITATKGTMDKLIETKTDTLSEEWELFKRDFEVNKLKPLGEMLEDLTKKIIKFFNESNVAIEDGLDDFDDLLDDWEEGAKKKFNEFKKSALKILGDWKEDAVDEFNDAMDEMIDSIDRLVDFFIGVKKDFDSFTNGIADGFDGIVDSVGRVINKVANLKFPSPPDWLPGFADGVRNLSTDTLAVVGERGPELVYLPQGSSVYSNEESKQMINNAQGYNNLIPGQKTEQIIIENVIIDPKNIEDMTSFINIINNFKNTTLSYGG
jgi:phage-related minor tail protein